MNGQLLCMPYYAVKTIKGYEQQVADMLTDKGDGVVAGLVPDQVVSYIMIEADDFNSIDRVMDEVPNATKIVRDGAELPDSEVLQFLEPAGDVDHISPGDLVEVTEGPFSGEKAKITDIDESDGSVTVEIAEATVPIPVNMKGKNVRRLDSDERK